MKNPPTLKTDFFNRPQVFQPRPNEQITVAMTPLAHCEVTAVDQDNAHLQESNRLVAERRLVEHRVADLLSSTGALRAAARIDRDYFAAAEDTFHQPFEVKTNSEGKAILELPVGKQDLAVSSDVYELPASWDARVQGSACCWRNGPSDPAASAARHRKTWRLGQTCRCGIWMHHPRRSANLRPAGRAAKMDEFEKRFREAKNQNDPQLLSEAYSTVADAFTDAGDSEEAAKWRHKAEEQAAKVTGRSKQPRAEDLQSREANSAAPVVEVPTQPIAVKALEKLDSALWVATSAEYVACARQTFNLAGEKLDLRYETKHGLPPRNSSKRAAIKTCPRR